MTTPLATLRRLAMILAVAAGVALAGCTSYTYNCNVKDACRTSDATAPGVHVVTGTPGAPSPTAAPPR